MINSTFNNLEDYRIVPYPRERILLCVVPVWYGTGNKFWKSVCFLCKKYYESVYCAESDYCVCTVPVPVPTRYEKVGWGRDQKKFQIRLIAAFHKNMEGGWRVVVVCDTLWRSMWVPYMNFRGFEVCSVQARAERVSQWGTALLSPPPPPPSPQTQSYPSVGGWGGGE